MISGPPVPRRTWDGTLPEGPAVITDLTRGWRARAWSIPLLRERFGAAPITVVRVEAGAVVMDPRCGLVARPSRLDQFLRALERGEPEGYLMTDLHALPVALAAEAPISDSCPATRWRTSRLWISAAGTTSALHFDVAHNLHAVLAGRKRFTLFPPSQSALLYPRGPLASMPNASCVDLDEPDYRRFPRLQRAHPLVAEVGTGETLFLPGGWWHHVRTVEHTIAVNAFFAGGLRGALLSAVNVYKRVRGLSR